MDTTKDYALDWVRNNISKDDIIRWANDYYWESFHKDTKENIQQLVDKVNEENSEYETEEVENYDEEDVWNLLGDDFVEALEEEIDCAW